MTTNHDFTSVFVATLQDVELRTTQARIASTIGKQSGQKQADFLRSELERIGLVARAAIDKAADAQATIDALLAALERLVAADNCNYLVETMRYEGYFDAAREAIAKAKGE